VWGRRRARKSADCFCRGGTGEDVGCAAAAGCRAWPDKVRGKETLATNSKKTQARVRRTAVRRPADLHPGPAAPERKPGAEMNLSTNFTVRIHQHSSQRSYRGGKRGLRWRDVAIIRTRMGDQDVTFVQETCLWYRESAQDGKEKWKSRQKPAFSRIDLLDGFDCGGPVPRIRAPDSGQRNKRAGAAWFAGPGRERILWRRSAPPPHNG
jgi:hypothetical protein